MKAWARPISRIMANDKQPVCENPWFGMPLKAGPGGNQMGLAGVRPLDQPTVDQVRQRLLEANGGMGVEEMPKRDGLGQHKAESDKGATAVKQLFVCQLRQCVIRTHQSSRRHIPRPRMSFST